jgi:hypothetical protein
MKSGGEPNSREHQSGCQQNALSSMSPRGVDRTCNRSSPTRNGSDHSCTALPPLWCGFSVGPATLLMTPVEIAVSSTRAACLKSPPRLHLVLLSRHKHRLQIRRWESSSALALSADARYGKSCLLETAKTNRWLGSRSLDKL